MAPINMIFQQRKKNSPLKTSLSNVLSSLYLHREAFDLHKVVICVIE